MSVDSDTIDVLGADGEEATTVLDRITAELDPTEIHAVALTATRGSTHYAVVASTGRNSGGDVIDLRTVVVDLAEENVRRTDNGMWIPYDEDAVLAVLRGLSRTHTDVRETDGEAREPLALSAVAADAEEVLSTPVEDEEDHDPDGWGEEYGNGAGEPPQVHDLVDRLREADLRVDRFSRLDFESKTPWERYAERTADELLGNYGVETLEEGSLVVLDVDYPEDAPDLPETYAVSSPNGSDERAHYYYRLPEDVDKHGLFDYYGSWALKPSWGDVWIAGEYVVGPGSRADGGSYDVVADRPIETIEAAELMDLVPRSVEGDEEATGVEEETETETDVEDDRAGADEAVDDDRGDEDGDEDGDETDGVECDACGEVVDREEATLDDRGDGPVYVCEVCHE